MFQIFQIQAPIFPSKKKKRMTKLLQSKFVFQKSHHMEDFLAMSNLPKVPIFWTTLEKYHLNSNWEQAASLNWILTRF